MLLQVAVRCRPLLQAERDNNVQTITRVVDNKVSYWTSVPQAGLQPHAFNSAGSIHYDHFILTEQSFSRPYCGHEEPKQYAALKTMYAQVVIVLEPELPPDRTFLSERHQAADSQARTRERRYIFDHAFDGDATNSSVYQQTVQVLSCSCRLPVKDSGAVGIC